MDIIYYRDKLLLNRSNNGTNESENETDQHKVYEAVLRDINNRMNARL